MRFCFFFPSLWQLCPSEDQLWRRCCCLDRGDPDGAGYAGNPAATGTGGMMLLGFFLASGNFHSKGFPGWSFFIVWHNRNSNSTPGWSPSLLLGASGTQRATLSGIFLFEAPRLPLQSYIHGSTCSHQITCSPRGGSWSQLQSTSYQGPYPSHHPSALGEFPR